jgi:hypothetical protein
MQRITTEQTKAPQFISAAKVQNFDWSKTKTAIKFEGQNYFPVSYPEIVALRKRMTLHHKIFKNETSEIVLWY